jgi:hypothetical protein
MGLPSWRKVHSFAEAVAGRIATEARREGNEVHVGEVEYDWHSFLG